MIPIIIGILVTGGTLYIAQFVALATNTARFLIYLFSTLSVWALLSGAGNKERWILLRQKDGEPLTKWMLAGVAAAVVALVMLVLLVAYQWWIPTLVVICITTICWESIFKSVRDAYQGACEKRKKAQAEAKKQGNEGQKAMPNPSTMALKGRGEPEPDLQSAVEQEIGELYSE